MARINSNVPALVAQANLKRANSDLEVRLNRLATGLRINRGADDPAGLIVSERLRSDIRGAEQGIKNSERASSVIATTEGALSEVNDLLNSIKALVVEAANTGAFSEEEMEANQLQINSAIDSITRISNTATFGGLNLLNGQLDYTLSSVDQTAISSARVHGASFVGQPQLQVEVDVLASAQTGGLYVRGDLPTPGDPANGTVLSTTTLRIAGDRGVTELSFLSGTSLDDVINAVNKLTAATGVTAERINSLDVNSGIVFQSEKYGADAFVSVERLNSPPTGDSWSTFSLAGNAAVPGPFDWSSPSLAAANRDSGRDVTALINGTVANGNGLEIEVNSQGLSLSLLLDEDFAIDPSVTASSFYITGGGALFQLGGEITQAQQSNIGVQSVAASLLGGTLNTSGQLEYLSSLKSGGANSLRANKQSGDFSQASDILEKAIDETSVLRGRLGAFERNVLQPNIRSLQTSIENLSASDSVIRDADFAYETSRLSRAQILTSTATSVLGLANQQSQQVLQLLG